MRLSVRAVNMIYIIRDYSPILTVLAMIFVPVVLIPKSDAYDVFTSIIPRHRASLYWAQRLFLAVYLTRTFHAYVTYSHVDLSRVANIHGQELWSAPCKQPISVRSRDDFIIERLAPFPFHPPSQHYANPLISSFAPFHVFTSFRFP